MLLVKMKLLVEIYNLIKQTSSPKQKRKKYKDLIQPSSTDKGGTEMTYPNVYKEKKDIGAKTKISKKTVKVRNSQTGRIYGRRTIYSK